MSDRHLAWVWGGVVLAVGLAPAALADGYFGRDVNRRRAAAEPPRPVPVQASPALSAARARLLEAQRAQQEEAAEGRALLSALAAYAAPLLQESSTAVEFLRKDAPLERLVPAPTEPANVPVSFATLYASRALASKSRQDFLDAARVLVERKLMGDDLRTALSGPQAREFLKALEAERVARREFAARGLAAERAVVESMEKLEEGAAEYAVPTRAAFSIDDLVDNGFSLRRAFDQDGQKEGARGTYFRDFDSQDDAFSAELCLKWQKELAAPGSWARDATFYLAFDANVTTGAETEKHFWGAHGGASVLLDFDRAAFDPGDVIMDRHAKLLQASLGARYLRRTDGEQEQAVAELLLRPHFGSLALGVRRGHETIAPGAPSVDEKGCCCTPNNWISWQWDVDARVAGGRNVEHSDGLERESTVFRTYVAVSGILYLDGLGRAMGADPWDVSGFPFVQVAYQAWGFPLEASGWRDAFDVSLRVPLSHVMALEASYHNGASEPDYSSVEQLTISITALF